MFNKVSEKVLTSFKEIVGAPFCLVDDESKLHYSHDETEDLHYYPEVILKPVSTVQVSAIMKICFDENIPVTPRGAGTGLSGGALPLHGGVVLSLERMNHIINLDEKNFQVTLEPGMITEELQNAVREVGLFYPPDPASKGSCFIGGNIAENSGGPKAVKYGVVKDYVLNLEMVLPDGNIIWTGANVLKNATGYNLTQLVVGSEGTLGVVTKIVLRLIPHPQHTVLMLAPFQSASKACEAVNKIFLGGFTPSAMEFMERDAIDWAITYTQSNMQMNENVQAQLLVELDGNDLEQMMKEAEQVSVLLEESGATEILFADSDAQKNELWKLRRSVAEAIKAQSVYKEEDTVVPRAYLPELLHGVKNIGKKYGFQSVCYGHAGDGNLHVNIIKGNLDEQTWNNQLPIAIAELFQLCKSLGGTISGEHGIGLVQKQFMPIVFSEVELNLQRSIKNVFDPKGIMNPGKIF